MKIRIGSGQKERKNQLVGVSVVKKKGQPRPGGPLSDKVSATAMKTAAGGGQTYFVRNWTPEGHEWPYYVLYGVERFQSFRENAESITDPSPQWYNDGVKFLKEKQNDDGSFTGPSQYYCSTAFAVLFLTRSTKKALGGLESGELLGGNGLPDDLTSLTVDSNGQIQKSETEAGVDSLLDLANNPEFQKFEALVKRGVPEGMTERDKATYLLRKKMTNPNYALRLLTVKKMARERKMDHVPALIFALTDPDPTIVITARDGLRFLSRKFEGFGLPRKYDENQRLAAIGEWKKWYSNLRPSAKYLD